MKTPPERAAFFFVSDLGWGASNECGWKAE
jgi:hypothetical protein